MYSGIDVLSPNKALQSTGHFEGMPANLGLNYLCWLEIVNIGGTATFQGVYANNSMSGIIGKVMS
jgi:hypothetical protein